MSPSLWQPDAINIRELKALVRRLDALIGMKQQEVNRLDVADQVIVPDIQNHINELHKRIEQIRKDIKDHIDSDPDLKKQKELLLSIPGVGEATVASLSLSFCINPSILKC